MKTLLLFLAVIVALPSLVFGADWRYNFDDAQRAARRSGKHLLLYFHSEGCGYCKKLEREALNTKRFSKYADDKLVLFDADMTRHGRRPGRYGVQNHRLADHYGVQGYPTMILLNPNGSHAGTINYRGGGAEGLTSQIDKVRNRKGNSGKHHHHHSGRR